MRGGDAEARDNAVHSLEQTEQVNTSQRELAARTCGDAAKLLSSGPLDAATLDAQAASLAHQATNLANLARMKRLREAVRSFGR